MKDGNVAGAFTMEEGWDFSLALNPKSGASLGTVLFSFPPGGILSELLRWPLRVHLCHNSLLFLLYEA